MRAAAILLLVVVLSAALPARAAAPARSLSVLGRGHGVRIKLIVPQSSYKRDWWIDAAVRITNVSRAPIYLNGYPQSCWFTQYNGYNPIVLEQSARGRTVYPPRARGVTRCQAPTPFRVAPGRTVRQLIYAPARGPYLLASVQLRMQGKRGKHWTVQVRTPRLHIAIR